MIVEDDESQADLIKEYFSDEGFDVTSIHNGREAIDAIVNEQPVAVILDVNLPDIDGVEVCRKVRKHYSNPILMLTGAKNEHAEISALNFGADKYIHKPIRPQVLLAHLRSSLKTCQGFGNELTTKVTTPKPTIMLDEARMEVKVCGRPIEVTRGEFETLKVLIHFGERAISREEIYFKVRGIEFDGQDRYIDAKVSSLRKKLGDDSAPYKYIKTIRNIGYVFCNPDCLHA